MTLRKLILAAAGGVALLGAAFLLGAWMFVYDVPNDRCLVRIRKTGQPLPAGQTIAEAGQMGIQRETLGPGRYFLNPLVWDKQLVPLTEVSAGDPSGWRDHYEETGSDIAPPRIEGKWPQVGIIVNKVGKPAPPDQQVVDEGFQGIQKRVLTPGTYRINPHVYEVKMAPATVVPLGFCGVVTSQVGDMPDSEIVQDVSVGPDGKPVKGEPMEIRKLAKVGQRGVMERVLQPGVYYLNPYVYKVQLVQVGYNQMTQLKSADVSDQIMFPSKDGFTIMVEVTVVWGRQPAHTAEMINRFGEIEKIKQIVLGQMRSICRNIGSKYESTDFIRGEKRELYQREVTESLKTVCRQRDIDLLIALIHNIEVHGSADAEREGMDLKQTIQRGFIAREQDLTKQAQRETARVRADLESAKVLVDVAREQITATTRKSVAEILAEGQKKAQEIDAQRDLEVATIERQIAELDAQTRLVLGRAEAQVEQLANQADADGKRMLIEALGSGRAYNLYKFASGFAPESVRLIFAGEGTFWTDLKGMQEAASLELLREANGAPARR